MMEIKLERMAEIPNAAPDVQLGIAAQNVGVAIRNQRRLFARIAELEAENERLKSELTACRQDHVDVIEAAVDRVYDAVLALPRLTVDHWVETTSPDGYYIRVSDIEQLRRKEAGLRPNPQWDIGIQRDPSL